MSAKVGITAVGGLWWSVGVHQPVQHEAGRAMVGSTIGAAKNCRIGQLTSPISNVCICCLQNLLSNLYAHSWYHCQEEYGHIVNVICTSDQTLNSFWIVCKAAEHAWSEPMLLDHSLADTSSGAQEWRRPRHASQHAEGLCEIWIHECALCIACLSSMHFHDHILIFTIAQGGYSWSRTLSPTPKMKNWKP